ncbi:MAG TPA: hypothetical protein PK990_08005 [Salinivirgaceae bacterium]|nr:hypothetical protein [Salinivirgaceae bacterium]
MKKAKNESPRERLYNDEFDRSFKGRKSIPTSKKKKNYSIYDEFEEDSEEPINHRKKSESIWDYFEEEEDA